MPVLTEYKFKELYDKANHLRAVGAEGAAREVLLFLFDYGDAAGGYGVVRLTFVLRDLSELAGLTGQDHGTEGKKALQELAERRDAREAAARKGDADFNQLQELVALNRTLNEPQRTMALYKDLQEPARTQPEAAESRQMLADLLREDVFLTDAEKIADQILLEKLKRRVLELSHRVAELSAGQPREVELRQLVIAAKNLSDRYRTLDDLPRGDEVKQRLVNLSREIAGLFQRHALLRGLPQGADARPRLEAMAHDLVALAARYDIKREMLLDEEQRDGILRLARKVASQISEYRIEEDFGAETANRTAEMRALLGEKIARDGLLVYEVLLRIDDEAIAEKVGAWLLAFRQDGEMYSNLLEATRRARKPDIESRLREEAERLMIV